MKFSKSTNVDGCDKKRHVAVSYFTHIYIKIFQNLYYKRNPFNFYIEKMKDKCKNMHSINIFGI